MIYLNDARSAGEESGMNSILLDVNSRRRIRLPVWALMCYSLFTAWQMGIVFFSGDALSLNGRTPLPIVADNMAALIAAAYAASILFLIFLQKRSVAAARIGFSVSLSASLALYLPLSDAAVSALIAVQTFCCVFLIGVCISVAVNLFTPETALYDVFITSVFAQPLIAVLQNDVLPVSYPVFRAFTVAALALLLLFFFSLPKTEWPAYAKRNARLVKPRRFFAGIYFLIGITCMLTLFGSAVSESVKGGVTIFALSTAASGAAVFMIWRVRRVSVLRCGKVLVALGALGFLSALAGSLRPAFLYVSCALLGCGNLACCMTTFFGVTLMERYPSKMIMPAVMLLALATVALHSALLDALRTELPVLYMIYAVLALAAAVAYLLLEPYLLWSQRRGESGASVGAGRGMTLSELDAALGARASSPLSGQELRVAELILSGFSGAEIAETLNITENTVKGYRKNLYAKLGIHSLRELFVLAGPGRG